MGVVPIVIHCVFIGAGAAGIKRELSSRPTSAAALSPACLLPVIIVAMLFKNAVVLAAIAGAVSAQSSSTSSAASVSTSGIDSCILTCVESALSSAGCSSMYAFFFFFHLSLS